MRTLVLALCLVPLAPGWAISAEFKTTSGPFRVSLLSMHRQRDLMLVQGPWVWVDEDGRQRPIEKRAPKARSSTGPLFHARLRVTTEPRTLFRLEGTPTILEALDDLDQSLEAAPDEPTVPRRGVPVRGALATLDLRIPLSLPDQPGKTIKRLRGTIPVVVTGRTAEPVAVFSLADAKGKTTKLGNATITVSAVKLEPDHRATIALVARLDDEKGDFRDRAYQAQVATKLTDIVQQQVEIVDDQTRPLATHPTSSVRRNEIRFTLRAAPGEQQGAPDRLRLFGLVRAPKEIPFDYKDVPMP